VHFAAHQKREAQMWGTAGFQITNSIRLYFDIFTLILFDAFGKKKYPKCVAKFEYSCCKYPRAGIARLNTNLFLVHW